MCGIKKTETPTLSPMDFVILTLMQVGQQASMRVGLRVWTSPDNHRKRVSETGCGLYRLAVSEKARLDHKTDALLERNIRYITADAGYTDLNRVKQLASQGVLLLTPVVGAKSDTARDIFRR